MTAIEVTARPSSNPSVKVAPAFGLRWTARKRAALYLQPWAS